VKLQLLNNMVKDKSFVGNVLAMTAVSLVSFLHFITFFPISIDDELAAFRTTPQDWVAQDRWFAWIVEAWFDQPVVPYLPYLIFIGLLVSSYLVIMYAVGLKAGWQSIIAFGLVSSFPTLWLMLSFAGNVLPVGWGFFLSAISLFVFTTAFEDSHLSDLKKWSLFALSAVLLSCAIGAYHSSALLFLVGVFAWVLLQNQVGVENFRFMALATGVFLVGALIWRLIADFLIFILQPPEGQLIYIAGFWRPEAFWSQPFDSIVSYMYSMFFHYSVDPFFYGATAPIAIVFFAVCLLSILLTKSRAPISRTVALAGLVASPFVFFIVSGVEGVPVRSLLTIGFVLGVLLLVSLEVQFKTLRYTSLILAGLLFVQLNQITAQYAAEERLAYEFNTSLASEIYNRMSTCGLEGDQPKQLSILGGRAFQSQYPTAQGSSSEGSFFGWYGSSPGRAVVFMRLLGYGDISLASEELLATKASVFASMPVFPEQGSMICSDGVNLLKLSD